MTRFCEILLIEWRNLGRDGLTIPFLIGAQQYLFDQQKWINVKELIINIAEESKNPISIRYCFNIKDIVLEILDERALKNAGYFPNLNGKKQDNLYITKFLQDLGDDVETIASKLEDEYKERIKRCKYSIVKTVPSDYTTNEIKFITDSFKIQNS